MRWHDTGHTMFGHRMKWMEVAEESDPYFILSLAYHNDCPLAATRARKKIGLCCFCTLDVCAKFAQFFIEMFVPAVDVIDPADFGNSVGLQSCKHQCSRRAQVTGHHGCSEKTIHTINHCGSTFQLHLR